jgi:hypothetical protein
MIQIATNRDYDLYHNEMEWINMHGEMRDVGDASACA